jgi:hypothetical protein
MRLHAQVCWVTEQTGRGARPQSVRPLRAQISHSCRFLKALQRGLPGLQLGALQQAWQQLLRLLHGQQPLPPGLGEVGCLVWSGLGPGDASWLLTADKALAS